MRPSGRRCETCTFFDPSQGQGRPGSGLCMNDANRLARPYGPDATRYIAVHGGTGWCRLHEEN